MNTWFTSDTHHSHKNIAGPKISNWKDGYRNFNSIQEMNQSIIDGINKYVKEDDTLWHLGDWSFGGKENIRLFRSQIICKNINLIVGNHDEWIEESPDEYKDCFLTIRDAYKGYIGKTYFHLNHFAHRVWNKSHRGSIHLYGHSHSSIPDFGKSMDVGIDAAYKIYGEYKPFHIDDIVRIMEKREIQKVDHHG